MAGQSEQSSVELSALDRKLHAACTNGELAKVKVLLAAGVDPARCRAEEGVTPLMVAAEGGHVDVVDALLEAGAPWHDQDDGGHTAGEYGMGHRGVLQRLLEWGVQAELVLGVLSGREVPDSADSANLAKVAVNQDYLSSAVRYEGATLLDEQGEAVMMTWEAPLMELHADIICAGGGDVLNVGFGLGIIDEAIQRRGPRSHTIVEAHPDVYQHMLRQGWGERAGVRVVFGRWQDVVASLGPFDGVFFDTYGEYYEELRDFQAHLPRLLRPGGVYSFFNGLAPDNLFFHMVYGEIARRELNALGMSVKYAAVPMDASADSIWEGVRNRYWHLKMYFVPTCVMEPKAALLKGPNTEGEAAPAANDPPPNS